MAFPTETVYGLGGVLSGSVRKRLVSLKRRDPGQPIGLFVYSKVQARQLSGPIPGYARKLMREFWPGPLTLVLRSSHPSLKPVIHRGTVGIRIPKQMWLSRILRQLNRPLLQTSANLSGQPPLTDPNQVLKLFGLQLDLVVSAGPMPAKKSSTVVDASGDFPIILRQGAISRTRILATTKRE